MRKKIKKKIQPPSMDPTMPPPIVPRGSEVPTFREKVDRIFNRSKCVFGKHHYKVIDYWKNDSDPDCYCECRNCGKKAY